MCIIRLHEPLLLALQRIAGERVLARHEATVCLLLDGAESAQLRPGWARARPRVQHVAGEQVDVASGNGCSAECDEDLAHLVLLR